MQQWTEQQIRLSLDGTFTFTRETHSGLRFFTKKVPRDYMPSFDPAPEYDLKFAPKKPFRGPKTRWSHQDEMTLIEFCRKGVSMEAAAAVMKRCAKTLRIRRRSLRDMGVI